MRCTPAEGKDVVRKLRGMYAFAIWDRRTRELFCARDPFGIKPFFYALTAGGHRPRSGPQLRFASERKALARPGRGVGDRPGRAAQVPVLPVRARAGDADAAGPLAAARARADRPARAAGSTCSGTGGPSCGRPGRPRRPRRRRSWPRCATRSPPTCAATCRSARSCPAAWTRPRSARSPPRRCPACSTFTAGFERDGYSEIEQAQATAAALGLKSVPYVISPEEFAARLPQDHLAPGRPDGGRGGRPALVRGPGGA